MPEKKRGRPPTDDPRKRTILIRLSEQEYARLVNLAQHLRKSISAAARWLMFRD